MQITLLLFLLSATTGALPIFTGDGYTGESCHHLSLIRRKIRPLPDTWHSKMMEHLRRTGRVRRITPGQVRLVTEAAGQTRRPSPPQNEHPPQQPDQHSPQHSSQQNQHPPHDNDSSTDLEGGPPRVGTVMEAHQTTTEHNQHPDPPDHRHENGSGSDSEVSGSDSEGEQPRVWTAMQAQVLIPMRAQQVDIRHGPGSPATQHQRQPPQNQPPMGEGSGSGNHDDVAEGGGQRR